MTDEILNNRLDKIEKRLDKVERELEELNIKLDYEKSELGCAIDDIKSSLQSQ